MNILYAQRPRRHGLHLDGWMCGRPTDRMISSASKIVRLKFAIYSSLPPPQKKKFPAVVAQIVLSVHPRGDPLSKSQDRLKLLTVSSMMSGSGMMDHGDGNNSRSPVSREYISGEAVIVKHMAQY